MLMLEVVFLALSWTKALCEPPTVRFCNWQYWSMFQLSLCKLFSSCIQGKQNQTWQKYYLGGSQSFIRFCFLQTLRTLNRATGPIILYDWLKIFLKNACVMVLLQGMNIPYMALLKRLLFFFLSIENPRCHYKALTFVPIAKTFFKYS